MTSFSLVQCLSSLRPRKGQRIGLLGGSFNPAHDGHVHISRMAARHLGLDVVWWLVSPQNPLKPAKGMAPLADRLAAARAQVRPAGGRIRVTAIEAALGTRYTVDTVKALKSCLPGVKFVWLMGADNLGQVTQWKDWQTLFRLVPIAVLPRPSYASRVLDSPAQRLFAASRLKATASTRKLADKKPPAWALVPIRMHGASSTNIRIGTKKAT